MKFIIPRDVEISRNKDGEYELYSNLWNKKVKIYDESLYTELNNVIMYGNEKIVTPLTAFLYKQKMLFADNCEDEYVDSIHLKLDKILKITIMPTEACNFRCIYCYENHISETMNEETLAAIKKFILEHKDCYDTIMIDWFGGEPTLCKDIIDDMHTFLNKAIDFKKVMFASGMTTNGYLLDCTSFTDYYKLGITEFQITIDSWSHDESRPLIDGGGTLKKIIDNLVDISHLPKNEYNFKIIIRNNILDGNLDFSWYDYLKELFGSDERFMVLVKPVSDYGGEGVSKLNVLSKAEVDEYINMHVAYLVKIGLHCANHRGRLLGENMCYAALKNSYVFRANGNTEKCTVALGNPKNKIGKTKDGKIIIDFDKNLPWHNYLLKKECMECEYLVSCMNLPCPKRVLIDGKISYCIKDNGGILK